MELHTPPVTPGVHLTKYSDGYAHLVRARDLRGLPASSLGTRASLVVGWESRGLGGETGANVEFELWRNPSATSVAEPGRAATTTSVTLRWNDPWTPDAEQAHTQLNRRTHVAARIHEILLAFVNTRDGVAISQFRASLPTREVILRYSLTGTGADLFDDAEHALRTHQDLLRIVAATPISAPFGLGSLPPVPDTFIGPKHAARARAMSYKPGTCLDLIPGPPGDDRASTPMVSVITTGDASHPLVVVLDSYIDRQLPPADANRIPLEETLDLLRAETEQRVEVDLATWYDTVDALAVRGFDVVKFPPVFTLDAVLLTCCLRLGTPLIGEAFRQGFDAWRQFPGCAPNSENSQKGPNQSDVREALGS